MARGPPGGAFLGHSEPESQEWKVPIYLVFLCALSWCVLCSASCIVDLVNCYRKYGVSSLSSELMCFSGVCE